MENTYAVTLAARSFRTFMAIAARFDSELKQYDEVNAFVHASLDEEIYIRKPPGYRNDDKILKLNKALYGLRRSPLLWQKALIMIPSQLGFKEVPHEPCCMTSDDGILIFFYVDDIVLAYRKTEHCRAMKLISQLRNHINISGGEYLQWFLGIEVHRDRTQKTKHQCIAPSYYLMKDTRPVSQQIELIDISGKLALYCMPQLLPESISLSQCPD
jgi:Reverse transcriptase (RNA-dependent DNA polymerase)